MLDVYICDYVRTPFGRYGGALSPVRADDLGAVPIRVLLERNGSLDPERIDEVLFGCANQAGEDNRNVARMSSLLAGLPDSVPGATINRLCGSGMDAVGSAARMIATGQGDLAIAGGVESMSRAPFVMPKADTPFSRKASIEDTTIGWRFVNPLMKAQCGTDSMPETAENVAEDFNISREDQDLFAATSQERAEKAKEWRSGEITSVTIPKRRGDPIVVSGDEHPRPGTTVEALAKLPAPFRENGSVTAGNASGVNDGAAALLLARPSAVEEQNLKPMAKLVGMATAGVPPRIMGFGPAPASRKLMERLGLTIGSFDIIELNEAFAAQALAVTRDLGLPDFSDVVNPNGGAIALGHPLGASGARLVGTAARMLSEGKGKRALCTMCIGVGQGISVALEAC
ncbi:3-oxoadipyl-CoA thiolase [Marivibrio halodurans]|uniref:Beta-ketoadipyl-CoA thiolase n=1 Tax=Marivibrio halodurans TaxID=2039722 RepID=A0A8J7V2S0_9PROT|nr:3-oxoadipyl-CoA thiolase [Marivibrio halodurans]MBP5857456.1 3-oxoadipyl-CoA thiolase [Marivibrio halodurans]